MSAQHVFPSPVTTSPHARGLRARVARHPLAAFFLGAYAWSWLWWAPAAVAGEDAAGGVPMLVGAFGPALAAAAVVHLTGGSVRAWLRGLFRVRGLGRWLVGAALAPPLLVALASLWFWLAGNALDFGLLGERLAAYLPTLVFVAALGGGNEEPGWRGFALPRLLERFSPLRATLLLGFVWAFWHVPVLLAAENASHGLSALPFAGVIAVMAVGIACGYGVLLAYVWNRTQSIVPCILLHASYNTALGLLVLRTEESLQRGTHVVLTVAVTATFVAAAAAVTWATRGRLGYDADVYGRTPHGG